MNDGTNIARIAAAIGDPARAAVLTALMEDRALTATELGHVAGVTKQTMSAHLARLVAVGLIVATAQGRHRYFRLADPDVMVLLEFMTGVAFRAGAIRLRHSPKQPALRKARTCYDHLAGELAVHTFDTWLQRKLLRQSGEDLSLTAAGRDWFEQFGIDFAAVNRARRLPCRPCLDWTERRTHLAGGLGAAFLQRLGQWGWVRLDLRSRVVTFSVRGERELRARLQR